MRLIFFSFILISCGKALPDFGPIDLTTWKNDKGGCDSSRFRAIDDLRDQLGKIKGLSETQVIELFGRPDRNELYKRNQKFYYYDLEPGKACNSNSDNLQLIIRYTAMGIANEVTIDNPN